MVNPDKKTAEEMLFGTKEENKDAESRGMIALDSKFGKQFGFTSDKFGRGSYLWDNGDDIFISFIESKDRGKGHFSTLIKGIESKGYRVLVPTPLAQMENILTKWGWCPRYKREGAILWGRPETKVEVPK